MKRHWFFSIAICGLLTATASAGIYEHGTVVKMHMNDCVLMHRGFMASFGGPQTPQPEESCPEYTLVSDKVVFVIVGKSSNQLIPLAEEIDFRLQRNELAIRIDDAKHESKFTIKEMTLRSVWDREQRSQEDEESSLSIHHAVDIPVAMIRQR
jgi:hypothetical protein